MSSPFTISCIRWTGILFVILALAAVTGANAQTPFFSKSFNPSTIGPGSVTTLRFIIDNTDEVPRDPVSDLAFVDVLPAGVTIASPANAGTTCAGGFVEAPAGGTTITFSGGGVAGNGSCSVTVDVTSSTPGTHTNVSGDLTSSAGNSGSATANLAVDTGRPGFLKSFAPNPIAVGGNSTLTLTIDNTANAAQAINLSFTDNLPGGMVVASPANASTTCGGGTLTAAPGTSVITYNPFPSGNSVAAGSSCTVTADVTAGIAGALGNTTGELTSGFPAVSSGKAAAVLTVDRPILTKTFTDDPVAPGGTVTLSFTVTNFDRSDALTGITFTDDLDAALTGLEAVGLPLADPCGPGSVLTGTGLLTLSGGSLAPEAACIFSVTLQVPAGAAPGTYTNTTSTIEAEIRGDGTSGPPATDNLVVAPLPLLTKAFTDDPVVPGGTVTLEFTITNTSATSSATGITFSDNLDAFLPGLGVTGLPANGFCGAGSSIFITTALPPVGSRSLLMAGGSLAAGASCTFDVTLEVPAGVTSGAYTNTTSPITATVDGETLTGNPAADALVVAAAPRLSKDFTDDPALPGETVTLAFSLAYDENAAAGATAIAFTDDLGAVVPGLEAVGLPLNDVCGAGSTISGTSTLSFTGGTLTPDASCTFSVTLQVPADALPGTFTNTTSDVTALVDGIPVTGPPASDNLLVAALSLTKAFTDDPAFPGATVTLEFTLENASPTNGAAAIAFTDDLDAVLTGLAAVGLPASDVCGAGSAISGTSLLSFTGGSLAPGASCTFSVTLQVPAAADVGVYPNRTSAVTADVGGNPVTVPAATDDLTVVEPLSLTKEFTDDPAFPGATVTLEFTLENASPTNGAAAIAFTDDLDAVLTGLAAVGLPASDVCGAGSAISGTSLLSFTGGSLAPGASCTFSVTLQVPAAAVDGNYSNTTSAVTADVGGNPVTAPPATDVLTVSDIVAISATKADVLLDGDGMAQPGDTLKYTVEINNAGGRPAASTVFTDTPGAHTTLVAGSVTTTQGTVTSGNTPGDTAVAVDLGSVGNTGTDVVIMFEAVIDRPFPAFVDRVGNQGFVSASNLGGPPVPTDDPDTPAPGDSTFTGVVALPVLAATKADALLDGDGVAHPGDTLKYTVVVSNTGDQDAASVVFTDTPGAQTTLVAGSVTTTQGTVTTGNTPGDTTVEVDLATLPGADATATVMFEVVIDAPLPAGVDSVFNQGLVTAANHADVDTDDPDTAAPGDATGTEVDAAPDLVVAKSDSLASAVPGQVLTYGIAYENDGDQHATGVEITETVPAGTTAGSNPGWEVGAAGSGVACDGQAAGTVCVFSAGAVAVGDSLRAAFVVVVDDPVGAGIEVVVDTVSVADDGANGADRNPADNTATDSTAIGAMAGIGATLSDALLVDVDGDGVADPGDTIRYTAVVSNTGDQDVADVLFTDVPDPNTTLVVGSVTTTQGTVTTGNTPGDTTVEVDLTTVGGEPRPFARRAAATITFDVTIDVPFPAGVGSVQTQGTVGFTGETGPEQILTDDPDTPPRLDPTVTPIDRMADLKVMKVVDDPTPDLGTDVTFAVTVTNLGPMQPAAAQVRDLLPAGLTLVSATASGTGRYDPATGRWDTGDIAYLDSDTLTIKATVATIEPVTNTARIRRTAQPDPNPDNNSAAATIAPVAADLDVDKTLIAFSENQGVVTATFLLLIANLGPSAATGVVVTDLLPDGVTLLSTVFSDPTDTYDPVTGHWTVGSLAVDGEATLALNVTAAATINILNLIEVTASDQPDQDPTNDIAGTKLGRDLPDPLRFRADVSLTKTVDDAAPEPDSLVVYTLVVSNGGPFPTAGVEVTDRLPEGLEFVAATGGTYDEETGIWAVGPLQNGASATLRITARVTGSGEIVNTAQVTGGHLADPDSEAGNAATHSEDDDAAATINVQPGSQPKAEASAGAGVPTRFVLDPNYPNPFNPETVIPYAVPEATRVRIAVYDLLGREVSVLLDGRVGVGRYEVVWQAGHHPTGMYLVRMEAVGVVQTRRVTLMK